MSCWFSFVGLVLTKSMVSNGSRWTWIQKIAILLGNRFLTYYKGMRGDPADRLADRHVGGYVDIQ